MPNPPPVPGSLCRATILQAKGGEGFVLIVSRWFDGPNIWEPHPTEEAAAQRLLELCSAAPSGGATTGRTRKTATRRT